MDHSFLEAGIKGYKGLVKEFVKEEDNGTISLTRCCKVSGLGPASNPSRDGSFDYYMSEPIRSNDAKGVGPFIWASLEMERMGYTVQNLFTYTGIEEKQATATPASTRCFSVAGQGAHTAASPGIYLHHNGTKWVKTLKR